MFDCEDCTDSFKRKSGLSTHRYWKHDDPADKVRRVCETCGEEWEAYESQLEWFPDRFCSLGCRSEFYSENWVGEDHPNFKGGKEGYECQTCGKEFERYPSQTHEEQPDFCSEGCAHESWRKDNPGDCVYLRKEWIELRNEVRERDEICQSCGDDGSDVRMEVHHIVPVRDFDNPTEAHFSENVVLLCSSCHRKVETGIIECPEPKIEE